MNSAKGNLPGIGKYKGVKRQGDLLSLSTYKALPVWLRGMFEVAPFV